jgi:DNA-binding transcriptional MerR regulator
MVQTSPLVDVPKRAAFRASEVCALVDVKPYVLRSWEIEFPSLGTAKTAGGARLYRRSDVEQVMRIKHLLLVDGLTLAGARRRLEEEAQLIVPEAPIEPLDQSARDCLTNIKHGLREILDLLAARHAGEALVIQQPATLVGSKAEGSRERPISNGRKSSSRPRQATRRKHAS